MILQILLSSSPGADALLVGVLTALFIALISFVFNKSKEKVSEIRTNSSLSKNTYDIDALKEQGFAALKSDYAKAIDSFEKVIRISSNDYEAALGLSIALHLDKQYNKSKDILEHIFVYKSFVYQDNLPNATAETVSLATYFWGHIKFMDGDIAEANRLKKIVEAVFPAYSNLESLIQRLNLY
jgi:tetratricopeptide (TPR) repeat protein